MYIGGINTGKRSSVNVIDQPTNRFSAGVSMGGQITRVDFGKKQQDVPVVFTNMPEYLMKSLKNYLIDTIGKNGTVIVTPDFGDDLQMGLNTSTNLVFLDFRATRLAFDVWNVECLFRNWYPPPALIFTGIAKQTIITSVA